MIQPPNAIIESSEWVFESFHYWHYFCCMFSLTFPSFSPTYSIDPYFTRRDRKKKRTHTSVDQVIRLLISFNRVTMLVDRPNSASCLCFAVINSNKRTTIIAIFRTRWGNKMLTSRQDSVCAAQIGTGNVAEANAIDYMFCTRRSYTNWLFRASVTLRHNFARVMYTLLLMYTLSFFSYNKSLKNAHDRSVVSARNEKKQQHLATESNYCAILALFVFVSII